MNWRTDYEDAPTPVLLAVDVGSDDLCVVLAHARMDRGHLSWWGSGWPSITQERVHGWQALPTPPEFNRRTDRAI